MGSMIQAKCSCGYKSDELLVGGGFINFMIKCSLPFYCDHCSIVSTTNILSKSGIKKYNRCPMCKRKVQCYGEIREEAYDYSENYVFDWLINDDKRYILPEGLHHCPKCKENNLKFFSSGCWD